MKKTDFTIVSIPAYVEGECPYCGEDFELDYDELTNISDYPGDWKDETIECPYCEREIIISEVHWE